jgi:Ca2+-binding RTX toxin-like protein
LIIGGAGDDTADFWEGGAVITFNPKNNEDHVYTNPGAPLVLSVGGGVSTDDVTMELVDDGYAVRIGFGDGGVTFGGYGSVYDPQSWPQGKLQIVGDDIRTYDLNSVVQQFLYYHDLYPSTTVWNVGFLLESAYISISETRAYGGGIAYAYATTGSATLPSDTLQANLGIADFGLMPTSIRTGGDIFGTEDSDELNGSDFADRIYGLGGDDEIYAGGGNDTLVGGEGEFDYLEGGSGDDTYVYESDDGIDEIFDESGDDTLQFGAGITPAEVQVTRDPWGNLYLVVESPQNRVEIDEWFNDFKIEHVEFADGTVWSAAQVEARIATLPGTSAADIVNGGDGDDFLDALAGDDAVYGNDGNDVLSGGDDDDYMEGNAGHNLMLGDAGDDDLEKGAGWGMNLFIGGQGDDFIAASGSADVLAFNAGDGADYVASAAGEALTISLGGGIAAGDIRLTNPGDGYSVLVEIGDSDSLALDQFAFEPQFWPTVTLQVIGSDIRMYDLNAVVQDFYNSGAPADWSAEASLESHVLSVSTTHAMGGAIAYQYATTGTTGGLSNTQIQSVLANGAFALAPQEIFVAGNQAPMFYSEIASQEAAEDAAFSFTLPAGTFSDPDGDALEYSATRVDGSALPAWLAFDPDTQTFSGTPLQGDVGLFQVLVTVSDGALSTEGAFTLSVNNVNDVPVVSASDATLLFDSSVAAASLFFVADEDEDVMSQYEFWDSTAGNGHWSIDGVEQGVNVTIAVSEEQLGDTTFTAASSIGSDLVWVRAYDGEAWSAWKSWYVASAPHVTNEAPVVTAAQGQLLLNDSVEAASLFLVTDADEDAIVGYEFWDDVAGGGYLSLDGVAQSSNPIPVSAAQLADLDYVAGAQPGTEQVWVRASDGMAWSAWQPWNMTSALHIPNAAPTVSVSNATVLLDQSVDAGTLFSAADADGDPIARYEFWDSTAGSGHFTVDGVEQGVNVGIVVSAAELADTQFVGSATTGSDLVWVRANDSQSWGEWKSWTVNSWPHAANARPVADAPDISILTNEVVAAASLFTVTDGDGDAMTQYELWDDVSGGGYWRLDGVQQGAAQTIAVSDLESVEYVGGASGGTEQVWVRANDGLEWSAWEAWNITTALHIPNAVPVVTASNATLLLSDAVQASSLFSVTDADADPITKYEFWDSTAGSGHFTVNGVQAGVNVTIAVTAAQLASTQFEAASSIGSDLVWVRANDGQSWSSWKSWYVASAPHLTNAAPMVTAAANGLLRDEAVSAASLFSVTDADADAITQYEFWDDVNGGGHWEIDGVQQAAAQTISVSDLDLENVEYLGGANAGTEQVWVRAYDGMAWSAWKNWLMSTEGGMLRGGLAPDTLTGEAGPTVLEGGGGDDDLTDTEGNNLFSGGEGEDSMTGGSGNDLFVGGEGDDTAHTGEGYNLIAYNAGGGLDTVYSAAGASNTLSLGGGLGYNALSLSKDGDDLILNTGGDNKIAFKDWYAGKDNVEKLQLVLDASEDYDSGSLDPLHNKKVQSFDFLGMVAQFDAAYAQSPGLSSWALTNALLAYHLSASDGAALGGDLAYWYGKNGALSGIGLASAQQVLASADFGADAQTLRPFNGLQEGFVKLN